MIPYYCNVIRKVKIERLSIRYNDLLNIVNNIFLV